MDVQSDISAILAHNVSSMMAQLPVHSHHRAPLVQALSQDLTSTAAAKALHTSASYVRQCKRKDYTDADLFHDKSVGEEAGERELCNLKARLTQHCLPLSLHHCRYARNVSAAVTNS